MKKQKALKLIWIVLISLVILSMLGFLLAPWF